MSSGEKKVGEKKQKKEEAVQVNRRCKKWAGGGGRRKVYDGRRARERKRGERRQGQLLCFELLRRESQFKVEKCFTKCFEHF